MLFARAPSLPGKEVQAKSDTPGATPWSKKALNLGPKGEIVVGIDLGTMYSCIAIAEDNDVRVLSTRRRSPTLPSVVNYDESGRVVIGDAAIRRIPTEPTTTIQGWKRVLGRPYDSPIVEEIRRHFAYEFAQAPNGETG